MLIKQSAGLVSPNGSELQRKENICALYFLYGKEEKFEFGKRDQWQE